MKKFIIAALLFAPSLAFAASVQIYPTITNAHGGTSYARDIEVCWEVDGIRSCDTGVPTFQVSPNSVFKVITTPPEGYSAVLGDSCAGTITNEDSVTCNVRYADGYKASKVVPTPPPAASAAPQGPAPVAPQPAPAPATSKLTTAQVDALVGLLRAFGVDEATITVVESFLR